MPKYFFALFLLVSPLVVVSQPYVLSGRISDSLTHEPLAFVNIIINEGSRGGVTDIDGKFRLESVDNIRTLTLSYVGYERKKVLLSGNERSLVLEMKSKETTLSGVLIMAGENPAHRIVRNAAANRKLNNPYNIGSFTFTSYDKMIFTVNRDSLLAEDTAVPDPEELRLRKILETQHLFMLESVAEHQYRFPGKTHDRIIASRASGFKDPMFIFLISQLQSTSFYDNQINIAGTQYVNPVSNDAEKLYFFHLKDTIYGKNPGDTTFVISYRPRDGRNFDGMKGLLYISNNRWAIQHVTAEPAIANQTLSMRIRQMYELVDGRQWFPVQLNTEIIFNGMSAGRNKVLGIGKNYRRNVVLDAQIEDPAPGYVAVEIAGEATSVSEAFWQQYRVDSLSVRERNTYRIIDSLGRKHGFDARMKGMSALLSGRLPLGFTDLDLKRLFRINRYEGTYLGIGLHTSQKLSERFSLGGYVGYGFKDQELKYGADLQLNLLRYDKFTFRMSYDYDLEESGGTGFFDDDAGSLTSYEYRKLMLSRFDQSETMKVMAASRLLGVLKIAAGIAYQHKQAAYDYFWQQSGEGLSVMNNDFAYGKVLAGVKFTPGEKFIRTATQQVSIGARHPVIWLQYTGSAGGFLGGQLTYHRFDFRMKYAFDTRLIGRTGIQLEAGYTDRPVPMSELYNAKGSRGDIFTIYSPVSFQTMRVHEFLSDRHLAVYLLHSFRKLLIRSEFFEPEISLALNATLGSLRQPERHRNASFNTLEKGYYEAGLLVNNLLKSSFSGIGLGVFYRMGPYSFDKAAENLAFKLSFSYGF